MAKNNRTYAELNTAYKEIGRRICSLRKASSYSQAQLAEIIGKSDNYVSELENGKKGMSQDTLCVLCQTFNVTADYILFGNPGPNWSEIIISCSSNLQTEQLSNVIAYLNSLRELRLAAEKK